MKPLLSILMACFFLGSNLGFTLTTHYCMGKAVKSEWQLGYQGLSCGMSQPIPQTQKECPSALGDSREKDGCCDTEYQTVKLKDSFQKAQNSEIQVPKVVFPPNFNNRCSIPSARMRPATAYLFPPLYNLPPPLKPSRTVLFQVFLV